MTCPFKQCILKLLFWVPAYSDIPINNKLHQLIRMCIVHGYTGKCRLVDGRLQPGGLTGIHNSDFIVRDIRWAEIGSFFYFLFLG